MNGFLGSHPVANGLPSTCPVDDKSLATLLVDNALLRAQLVLLREGTYVNVTKARRHLVKQTPPMEACESNVCPCLVVGVSFLCCVCGRRVLLILGWLHYKDVWHV